VMECGSGVPSILVKELGWFCAFPEKNLMFF